MRETSEMAKLIARIRDTGHRAAGRTRHDPGDEHLGRSVVLSYGEKIADDKPLAIQKHPEVIKVYLGRTMLRIRSLEAGYGNLKVLRRCQSTFHPARS